MSANNLTNTGLSVQTLLDTLKAIGEQYAEDNPDYLWIELYRDGSWGIKFETHDPDSETEELMEGDSIHEDFIRNVAHWLENQ